MASCAQKGAPAVTSRGEPSSTGSHICAKGSPSARHIASSSAVALSATRGSVRATRARMFASVPSRSAPQVNSPCLRTHAETKSKTSPRLVVCVSSRHSMTPSGVCALGSSAGSSRNTGNASEDCTRQSMAIARRRYSVGR